MDVLVMLQGKSFQRMAYNFKKREQELGHGLSLVDFVEVMLSSLSRHKSLKERNVMVGALIDLFNDIDVNGDKKLEFEEFSSHCIEAGMVAANAENTKVKTEYIEHPKYVDRTTQGESILRLRWFDDLSELFVIETEARTVRVYQSDGTWIQDIRTDMTRSFDHEKAKTLDSSIVNAPPSSTNDGYVQDVEYIASMKEMVTCSSDFTLAFWDTTAKYKFVTVLYCQTAQRTLRWVSASNYLLSTGNDGVIFVWKITKEQRILRRTFAAHADVIMDMLELTRHNLIVTCAMDKRILLWGIHDLRPRGSLDGHIRGVRQLLYSQRKDMLFSIGFEFTAYGWNIGSRQFILKLEGHRHSLVAIHFVELEGKERVITADQEGVFKVWDFETENGLNGLLLESFSSKTSLSKFIPSDFIVVPRDKSIVAAGKVLRIFKPIRALHDDIIPITAFYNATTNEVSAVNNASVHVWSGSTGSFLREHPNCTPCDIVACAVDGPSRKLIVAMEDGHVALLTTTRYVILKSTLEPVLEPILSVLYAPQDKVFMVCTKKGSLLAYDERECTLLRAVHSKHDDDGLAACAFSYHASLLATAGFDRFIRMWNFQDFECEDVCQDALRSEVLLLQFLDPFPILLVVDTASRIYFYTTRPHLQPGDCLYVLDAPRIFLAHESKRPSSDSKTTFVTQVPELSSEMNLSITCLQSTYHSDLGTCCLYTGDDSGRIVAWDISPLLKRLAVQPITEEKLMWNKASYNPRRMHQLSSKPEISRSNGDEKEKGKDKKQGQRTRKIQTARRRGGGGGGNACQLLNKQDDVKPSLAQKRTSDAPADASDPCKKPLQQPTTSSPTISSSHAASSIEDFTSRSTLSSDSFSDVVVVVTSWQAHQTAVHSLRLSTSPQLLFSTAFSKLLKLWTFDGTLVGQLGGPLHTTRWRMDLSQEADSNSSRDENIERLVQELQKRAEDRLLNAQAAADSDGEASAMQEEKSNRELKELKDKGVVSLHSTVSPLLRDLILKVKMRKLHAHGREKDSEVENLLLGDGTLNSYFEKEEMKKRDEEVEGNSQRCTRNRLLKQLVVRSKTSFTNEELKEATEDKEEKEKTDIEGLSDVHYISNIQADKIEFDARVLDRSSSAPLLGYQQRREMEEKNRSMYDNLTGLTREKEEKFKRLRNKQTDTSPSSFLQAQFPRMNDLYPGMKSQLRVTTAGASLGKSLQDKVYQGQEAMEEKSLDTKTIKSRAVESEKVSKGRTTDASGDSMLAATRARTSHANVRPSNHTTITMPQKTSSHATSSASLLEPLSRDEKEPFPRRKSETQTRQTTLWNKKATLGKVKLEQINQIIHTAGTLPSNRFKATTSNGGTASLSLDRPTSSEEAIHEHKNALLARARLTQSRFNKATQSLIFMEEGDNVDEKVRLAKQQTKLENLGKREKRTKKYLRQKQKEIHSDMGRLLRNTSVAYHGNHRKDRSKRKSLDSRLGMYTFKEVMAVIRLFWSLDPENTGSIQVDVLSKSDMFLDIYGHGSMSSVFQSLDLDGSGDVTLIELLSVCFTYASQKQLNEMLVLAKTGRIQRQAKGDQPLTKRQREEITDIFNLFDKDGSGTVSVQEILDALQVSDASLFNDGDDDSGFTKTDIQKFYQECDTDNNMELDLEEFIDLLGDLYR